MTNDQPPGDQPWPQQGQPYPPPGYQQPGYPPPGYPPHGYPPQQYPPGYPPPGGGPRKSWPRRHPILTTIIALFGLFVVIVVVAGIAGTADHTVTTGQAGSTPAATSSGTASASSSASSIARVGSTITLAGNDSGEKMSVTVTRIISHGQPTDQYSTPDPGKRFYAVQFRLANTGSAAYSDSPSNGAAVVDSAGQSYDSTFYDVAGCQSFPGTENIAAGQSGLGCIVFQVPVAAKITKVQFTLDSGFGPQTGQWDVRS